MKETIRFIQSHLTVQFSVRDLATSLRCHPIISVASSSSIRAWSSATMSAICASTWPASF